jgi:hypothetical protein
MMKPIGHFLWVIAEGYIPGQSFSQQKEFISHETACILNVCDKEAHIEITVYFSDREPAGPYKVNVPPKRTIHLRYNDLNVPEMIPRDTDYSSVISSDVPVIVQHTRLDSRRPELSLFSTIAYHNNL